MRGSMHNKDICEFTIDGCGLHVGKPFRNVVGILSGNPHMIAASEIERSTNFSAIHEKAP